MKEKAKGLLLVIAGAICIVVGIAGIFLPVIPGVPILLFGLHLVGVRIPLFDRWVSRFRKWLEDRQNRERSHRPS